MIYLDNNATTPLDVDVQQRMLDVAGTAMGNPGSRHLAGRRARQVLEEAREEVAAILDADADEVIFTSGGTESSNLALFGLAAGRSGSIVLPPGEHPATEEPVKQLIARGCRRITIPVDARGRISQESLADVCWDEVILATAILAHNETGVVQDLALLSELCESRNVPLHVDAVQAAGKLNVSFRGLRASTMSVGAHKFHGPRGIGALLVRRDCRLAPILFGGHQERGLRPGTEPVMLAAGMACALRNWHQDRIRRTAMLTEMRDRLQTQLVELCAPVIVHAVSDAAPMADFRSQIINEPQASALGELLVPERLPNTLSMAFPGCDAQTLLVALDLAGVCCSHGSACASGSAEPSPILLAMGVPPEIARASLRLTLGIQNTLEEIDRAARLIAEAVARVRALQETTALD